MKRLALFLLILPLFITACQKEPVADFTVSTTEAGIGESIIFTNRSVDGKNYEWDFGDGYISTNYNADHYYDEPGNYVVSLKAFGREGTSVATLTITILQTYLEITVEEYYEPYYLVAGATVKVYPTLQDWENETNVFSTGTTNANGMVTFSYLFPQRYYIDVWGPDHDNYELADEDAGFIETDVMIPGAINTFKALVDYYPPLSRSTDDTKVLKSQKKSISISTPRKPGDRVKIKK